MLRSMGCRVRHDLVIEQSSGISLWEVFCLLICLFLVETHGLGGSQFPTRD